MERFNSRLNYERERVLFLLGGFGINISWVRFGAPFLLLLSSSGRYIMVAILLSPTRSVTFLLIE